MQRRHAPAGKLILLMVVVAGSAVVWWTMRESLTLSALTERETELRRAIDERPLVATAIAFAVYVAVTGLSLPGASGLTLIYGWLFGFWRGLLLVSFASTTGATIAFLLSRFLLRDFIQARLGDRLETINESLRREGAFYLFTLRLIPAVPFFIVNVVMGLTPLPIRTYWWVSQLGMLPGTAVYISAGAAVPSLRVLAERGLSGIVTPQLLAAFALLGVFPLLVKRVIAFRLRKSTSATAANLPRAD